MLLRIVILLFVCFSCIFAVDDLVTQVELTKAERDGLGKKGVTDGMLTKAFGTLLMEENSVPTIPIPGSKFERLPLQDVTNTPLGFEYFNERPNAFQRLNVHFNGFISFGSGVLSFEGCPRVPSLTDSPDINLILPYSCSYFEGKVFAFTLNEENQKMRIMRDVNAVINGDLNAIDVTVITWYKMRSSGRFESTTKDFLNTFQVFLIKERAGARATRKSFVEFYYRSMDTSRDVTPENKFKCYCQKGFIRNNGNDNIIFDPSDKPQVIEYFSDETGNEFRDLGTYVFETTRNSGGLDKLDQSNCNDPPKNFKCDFRDQAVKVIAAAKKKRKRRSLDDISERVQRTMRPTQPSREQSTNTTTPTTRPTAPTTRFTISTTKFTTPTTNDNQTTIAPTTSELANRFCEFRNDGDFGFPIFCNVYVTCSRFSDGSPRAEFRVCSEGFNFDSEERVCVDENTYNCYLPPDIIDPNDPTIGPQPNGPLPCVEREAPLNGDIPDPESCSNFYSCSNGRSIIRSCPDGLFFNPANKYCDYPRNVDRDDCKVVTTPTTNTTTPTNTASTTKSTTTTKSTSTTRQGPTYRVH